MICLAGGVVFKSASRIQLSANSNVWVPVAHGSLLAPAQQYDRLGAQFSVVICACHCLNPAPKRGVLGETGTKSHATAVRADATCDGYRFVTMISCAAGHASGQVLYLYNGF